MHLSYFSKLIKVNREAEKSSVNLLSLGDQCAALGLLWQLAQHKIPLREQARVAGGAGNQLDIVVTFNEGKQYGFASTKEGLNANMLAGASLFSEANWGDNWLAAHYISDNLERWWIVAMRDRLVYEDQVCINEDTAKTLFLKSLEAPDWEKVIAPKHWDINGAETVDLYQSISTNQAAKLRPVNFWPRIRLLFATLALVVIGINFVISTYSKYPQQQMVELQKQPQFVAPSVMPWERFPNIYEFTVNCEQRLSALAITVPGWKLQKAECFFSDPLASLKLRWQRTNGSTAWIRSAVQELAGKEVTILNGGQLAEITSTFTLPRQTATENDNPLPPDILETLLRDRFVTLGLEIKLTAHNARPPIAVNNTQPNLGYHVISAATSASPSEYARLLSDLPALSPISLNYQPSTSHWLLNARVYHPAEHFDNIQSN